MHFPSSDLTHKQSLISSLILLDLILYVPCTIGWVFLGWTSTKLGLMCLAQGHNTVTPVRLEPAAPRSRFKHSTTEPLRSLIYRAWSEYSIYIWTRENFDKAQICSNYMIYTAPNNYQVSKWCTWLIVFRINPESRIFSIESQPQYAESGRL